MPDHHQPHSETTDGSGGLTGLVCPIFVVAEPSGAVRDLPSFKVNLILC